MAVCSSDHERRALVTVVPAVDLGAFFQQRQDIARPPRRSRVVQFIIQLFLHPDLHYLPFSRSRISGSRISWREAPALPFSAFFLFSLLIGLTKKKKIAKATSKNWKVVLANMPRFQVVTPAALASAMELKCRSVSERGMKKLLKSTLPTTSPKGGIRISSTSEVTILPKAPPIMTPIARSMTLPRMMNI